MVVRATRNGLHVTGYSECIDSFFAFGLFQSAKRSAFFPEALVDTFEPVIQEEARHILFYHWRRGPPHMPFWRRPFFELKCWPSGFFSSGSGSVSPAISEPESGQKFHHTGAKSWAMISTSPADRYCLAENQRRMSPYDRRLLRPSPSGPGGVGAPLHAVSAKTSRVDHAIA